MRLIDYFNIAATAASILVFVLFLIRQKRTEDAASDKSDRSLPDRAFLIGGLVFLLAGCILRLINQAGLPAGIHQDEANIGYEAWLLANFGMDRDLHPWPVYPITYGPGGGSPLLIYLNVLTTMLFGTSATVLRRTCAFLGCLTLPVFALLVYCITEWTSGRKRAVRAFCLASFLMAFNPWHIIDSRWTLDSNSMPLWELTAVLVLANAVHKKSTGLYMAAAALFALCLYGYGSANVIVPLYLLIVITYIMIKKRLTVKQFLLSGLSFLVVVLPLGIFYAVNYLGVPEIITSWISFNRFTTNRLTRVFIIQDEDFLSKLPQNFLGLIKMLTTGYDDGLYLNVISGYGQILAFTFPFLFLGIGVAILRSRGKLRADDNENSGVDNSFSYDMIMLILLAVTALFTLLVEQNVNRLVMFYPVIVYFLAVGLEFLMHRDNRHRLFILVMALILLGSASFVKDYFLRYNTTDEEWLAFMPGYTEASIYARDVMGDNEGTIWHTKNNVTELYPIAMYANLTDPYVFLDTVKYYPQVTEFRDAMSFDRFAFYLPDDLENGEFDPELHRGDIFIVNTYEESWFDPAIFEYTEFDRYAVVTYR